MYSLNLDSEACLACFRRIRANWRFLHSNWQLSEHLDQKRFKGIMLSWGAYRVLCVQMHAHMLNGTKEGALPQAMILMMLTCSHKVEKGDRHNM